MKNYMLSICVLLIIHVPADLLPAGENFCVQQIIQKAKAREKILMAGFVWEWNEQVGICREPEQAESIIFDPVFPIEAFKNTWALNSGEYFCQQIAQQPRKVLNEDSRAGVTEVTRGSNAYLFSNSARLFLDLEPFAKFSGILQHEKYGYNEMVRPYALPIHGMIFRFPVNDDNIGLNSETAKCAEYTDSNTGNIISKVDVYANDKERVVKSVLIRHSGNLPLQSISYDLDGKLARKTIILSSEVYQLGENSISLPNEIVSYSCNTDGTCYTRYLRTTKFSPTPADRSKMSLEIPVDTRFVLHSTGRLQVFDSSEVNIENLEEVVLRHFRENEAQRKEFDTNVKMIKASDGKDISARNSATYYVIIAVNGLILSAAVFLFYKNRPGY